MSDITTVTATSTASASKTSQINTTIQLKHDPSSITDISKLPAAEALRLLSTTLELLIKVTGDVPPTPPPRTPADPSMRDLQAEKEVIARVTGASPRPASLPTPTSSIPSASPPSASPTLSREETADRTKAETASPATGNGLSPLEAYRAAMTAQLKSAQQQAIDGVKLKNQPTTPPESDTKSLATEDAPPPIVVVGDDGTSPQPVNSQHGAITRKFYSKLEPPISITQYLTRLHQFCPMSTAVYLATSLYIHRLAIEQRAIPVTRRNVHRLVLAGLRVASKALEDLAYPHSKFSRVGGVSESELARLEISFCFLAGFELVIGCEGLTAHWESLRDGKWKMQEKALELRLKRPPKNGLAP